MTFDQVAVPILTAIASGVGVYLFTEWRKKAKKGQQSEDRAGLVTEDRCDRERGLCREQVEAQLLAGDERLSALSKGVAWLLRQIPKLCEGVGAPKCDEIEAAANALADDLLEAGKVRVEKKH
jgi:hypothetical protein